VQREKVCYIIRYYPVFSKSDMAGYGRRICLKDAAHTKWGIRFALGATQKFIIEGTLL
jgi:hypothetical protein